MTVPITEANKSSRPQTYMIYEKNPISYDQSYTNQLQNLYNIPSKVVKDEYIRPWFPCAANGLL